jgi:hypothetical protein
VGDRSDGRGRRRCQGDEFPLLYNSHHAGKGVVGQYEGFRGTFRRVWYLPVGEGPRWSSVDNRSPGRSGRGRGPESGILPGKGRSGVGYSLCFIDYRYAVAAASTLSVDDVSPC